MSGADAATTTTIGAGIGDLGLSVIPVNITPASDRWASGLGGSVVNHSQRGWRWYSVKRVLAVLATSDNPLVNHLAAQAHRRRRRLQQHLAGEAHPFQLVPTAAITATETAVKSVVGRKETTMNMRKDVKERQNEEIEIEDSKTRERRE